MAAGVDRPPWRTAMLAAPREGSMTDPALGVRRPSCAARVSGEVVRGQNVSKDMDTSHRLAAVLYSSRLPGSLPGRGLRTCGSRTVMVHRGLDDGHDLVLVAVDSQQICPDGTRGCIRRIERRWSESLSRFEVTESLSKPF